eukprot:Amastigsp_a846358_5.p3 type:complete len:198 gc:universal Amastigsp_a846358_5:196-789(+)
MSASSSRPAARVFRASAARVSMRGASDSSSYVRSAPMTRSNTGVASGSSTPQNTSNASTAPVSDGDPGATTSPFLIALCSRSGSSAALSERLMAAPHLAAVIPSSPVPDPSSSTRLPRQISGGCRATQSQAVYDADHTREPSSPTPVEFWMISTRCGVPPGDAHENSVVGGICARHRPNVSDTPSWRTPKMSALALG